VTHFTDLFEGHNFNRYKDSLTDDGTQKLPKHIGEVLSILFTFQCIYGWCDKLNLLACYAVSTCKYLTTFQRSVVPSKCQLFTSCQLISFHKINVHPKNCHELKGTG